MKSRFRRVNFLRRLLSQGCFKVCPANHHFARWLGGNSAGLGFGDRNSAKSFFKAPTTSAWDGCALPPSCLNLADAQARATCSRVGGWPAKAGSLPNARKASSSGVGGRLAGGRGEAAAEVVDAGNGFAEGVGAGTGGFCGAGAGGGFDAVDGGGLISGFRVGGSGDGAGGGHAACDTDFAVGVSV